MSVSTCVEEGRADEEAATAGLELAPVDDHCRALRGAGVDVADDSLARLRRDDGAHFGVGVQAGTDADRRARWATFATSSSAASPTATATEIAMQRCPAEPNPAAISWSAA